MGLGDATCRAAETIDLATGGHRPPQLLIWVGLGPVWDRTFFHDAETGDTALMSTLRMMRKDKLCCGVLARLAKEMPACLGSIGNPRYMLVVYMLKSLPHEQFFSFLSFPFLSFLLLRGNTSSDYIIGKKNSI